ncbi:pilus assembly protein TadG-related protein [Massilia sp. MS-15]|uniref:pilus assembly protein TadG-related protein n=1 Tax=Massilia sp. MS-15 TaxID=2878200 RepID=UPI001CD4AE8D|nr:pilus assembly protein TadG-related protein [Massilia sp. MS-15]MCA1245704.1 pilus assembly protein TadG-related protein [Massilia sp. MS-15]
MAFRRHPTGSGRPRQDGAFAVMFVPLLLVIIGLCGLAIDMARIYNRKVDMHGIAKAAALAAARELNGTPQGIVAAKLAAAEAAGKLRYQHFFEGTVPVWSDEALSFSDASARSGTWLPASSVGTGMPQGQAAGLFFARVDTAALGAAAGRVDTYFIQVLARVLHDDLAAVDVSDSAIAGRSAIKVTPLAVCAMAPDAAAVREAAAPSGAKLKELVQYGFRRGVSYDLMQLNPKGMAPARYAVNPVLEPGRTGPELDIRALAPFACTGSMWVRRITGGAVRVSELPAAEPLAALRSALNTRFDTYSGTTCTPDGGAPDTNIRMYAYDQANGAGWMSPGTGSVAALPATVRGRLETVADLPAPPPAPGDYGPLWSYARAARAPSSAQEPEPEDGYATFATGDWAALYPSGPSAQGYPAAPATPYQARPAPNAFYAPPRTAHKLLALPERRVLNIPLLDCAAGAPSGANVGAHVVAVGRFFMTVMATNERLVGEFAGLLPPQAVAAQVELYP